MAESAEPQCNGNENQTSESDSQDETPTRLLRLKIIAGHNLAKKDIFGASDPYVRVDLLPGDKDTVLDTYITKTKKRTLNPIWDEQFLLQVSPSQVLKIEVFDENRLTRDDFLGLVEVPLHNIPTERPGRTINAKHYILRPRSSKSRVKGYLEIYHAYQYTGTPEDDDSSSQQEAEVGWEMVNSENGTTILEETASPTSVPTPPSNHSPLPPGWEERQDANGRTYYVNHAARTLR